MTQDSMHREILSAAQLAMAQFQDYLDTARSQRPGALLTPEQFPSTFLELTAKARTESELKELIKCCLEFSTCTIAPTFMNQLFSGLRPYALVGEWLSTLLNGTMATYEVAPVATLMERQFIKFVNQLIGWHDGDGIMATGGSNANLLALLVARNHLFPQTKVQGLSSFAASSPLAVFVSEEAHYSFQKAVNLLGIGTRFLYAVPSDDQGRMLPEQLRQSIEQSKQRGECPFFIGATAGTTVLGAFDPLLPIAKIAREYGAWLHVDGAWGGSVLFSDQHRRLLEGLDLADSFCWDAHKMLGTGLISSFFHCKHPQSLRRSNDGGGSEYIFHESEVASYDLGPSSLQCGRRADIFKVWFHWQALGTEGIANQVNELMTFSQSAYQLLATEPRIKLLYPVTLLNLCFQFLPDPALAIKDLKVINQYQESCRQELIRRGNFFVNISRRRGLTFFRLILTNPQTKLSDIKSLVQELYQIDQGLMLNNDARTK